MKVTNKYNVDITRVVNLFLENKITSKEFQEYINQEDDKFKEFDKWFNKLARKNGTTKY